MSFSYDEMSSICSVTFCFGQKHVDGQNMLKHTTRRGKISKYIEGNKNISRNVQKNVNYDIMPGRCHGKKINQERNPFNQNFRAGVRKFLGVDHDGSRRSRSISLEKQVSPQKWRCWITVARV